MSHILGYVVLAVGVLGVVAGLVGLALPNLRGLRPSLRLPSLSLPFFGPAPDEHEAVESVLAELERSGFKQSPFEIPKPAPVAARPLQPSVPPPEPSITPTRAAAPEPPTVTVIPMPAVDVQDGLTDVEDEEDLLSEEDIEALAAADASAPEDETPKVVQVEAVDEATNDILALFDEKTEYHAAATAVREAIEDVTISDLLREAHELRELLGIKTKAPPAA